MTIVHKYTFDMDDAPQLDYGAGTLIAVLDACLVDGWVTSSGVTISGAGWTKEYEDVPNNLAVYRSSVSETITGGSPCYLYVNDNADHPYHYQAGNFRWADVHAYESMSSIDYTEAEGRINYDSYSHWFKVQAGSVNARWKIYATDRGFYYISGHSSDDTYRVMYFFGEYLSRDPNFPYNTVFTYSSQLDSNYNKPEYYAEFRDYNVNMKCIQRLWKHQRVVDNRFSWLTLMKGGLGWQTTLDYPDPLTGQLLLDKLRIISSTYTTYMGDMPGILEPMHQRPFIVDTTISGVGGDPTASGVVYDAVVIYAGQLMINTSNYWYE